MTQEDKDALYGKAKREEKEARSHFAFVQGEVARVSEVLGKFSNVLRHNAYLVQAEGAEFFVSSPLDGHKKLESFKLSDFDGEKIKALLVELESARLCLEKCQKEVQNLGG